ncbi:MAG: cation diffusion facilitator family transporter [Clostridiales bacterium]|nr:cation diffusion facilitator family transporter [Clostridiales bacterium]
MVQLIIRTFIKNYKDVENHHVREAYGKLAGIVGIISNIILFMIKFLVGVLFKSISVTADAVNNLSDAGSSIITLIGFKLSGKPADAKHPYGHARMEYITGLAVSFIIILLGVQLVQTSFDKVLHPEESVFSYLTIAVLIISILMKLWQGMFNKKVGKTIHSTALEATAADSINDVVATSAVLLSTVIAKWTGVNLDGYMGILVAVFILVSGVKMIGETINPLLGMAPDQEMVDQIYKKIMSYDTVLGIHDLVVHNYGPQRCFASVHVEVPASQDILVSHDIIDNIERDFAKDMDIHLVVHLDPIVTDDETTNLLRAQVKHIVKDISPDLSIHDFRAVIGVSHTNLIFDVCVPFSVKMSDAEITSLISQKVKEIDPTYYTVIVVDRSYTAQQ